MIGRTNTGCGGIGGTLTVTAPAGVTAKVTNDFNRIHTVHSKTENGLTLTVNSDKSITIDGTATGDVWLSLNGDEGLYNAEYANGFVYGIGVDLTGTGLRVFYNERDSSQNIIANSGFLDTVDRYTLKKTQENTAYFALGLNILSGSTFDNFTIANSLLPANLKTKTKQVGEDGVAIFKGLTTGDWMVTITDGIHSGTKTVHITADYSETLSFFTAAINFKYRPNTICSATDGLTTLYASDSDNASGSWKCIVPNAGTWTISCTTRGQIKTVDITEDGEEKDVVLPFYLYDPTAGYTIDMYTECQDSASVNIGTESIDVTFTDFASGVSIFRNLYQLSSQVGSTVYNTLHMTVKCTEQYINDEYAGYVFAETVGVGLYHVNPNAHTAMTKLTGNSIETEYTIDISRISGLGYYGIHGAWKGKVYKIWLE